jgi:REP element-mobilizing transposase RayT
MMREYRRHLPHQVPRDWPIFLTWNLKGAMPREAMERLRQQRDSLRRKPPRPGESPRERSLRHGKLLFAAADKALDCSTTGPLHLRDAVCADIVDQAILFGAGDRYDLLAWCVMPNHVHVLLAPHIDLSKVTQGIKGYTAREINQLQNQTGRTFWQDESYDHWVRDEEKLQRIIAYIEHNPVAVSLCATPAEWRWSSARYRDRWPVGQPFQPDAHRLDMPIRQGSSG